MHTCGLKKFEELQFIRSKEVLVEVGYVKANHTKEKKEMSHFDRFVTEGNEKTDELTKEGAMMDWGYMAEVRAKKVQQERRGICSLAVRSQFSLLGGGMEGL